MNGRELAVAGYEQAWSEAAWRDTLGRRARLAGRRLVEAALVLYYTLRAPDTPLWAKSVILGALGYFVSLVDAIPDLTPVLGYTDDLGVILGALTVVARSVTPAIRAQARARAAALFGED